MYRSVSDWISIYDYVLKRFPLNCMGKDCLVSISSHSAQLRCSIGNQRM